MRHLAKGRADLALAPASPSLLALLDLAFLVEHMLTYHGIKFLDLQLARLILLVFGGGIKVASPRRGIQADLVSP